MATSFHPSRSLPSRPISPASALGHLQTYLEATQNTTYLHPNAKLTISGPSAELSSSSLTLHNLRRVEAGLRGEWLAPSLELSTSGEKDRPNKKTRFGEEGDVMDVDMDGEAGMNGDSEEVWQDKEEFEREQDIVEGEVGPRETGVGQVGNIVVPVQVGTVDKEARKREKKERLKAEKKAKLAAK